MKILRRIAYALFALLIIGWGAGWFLGKAFINRELGGTLTSRDLGDVTYSASSYTISGFPFTYRINLQHAELRESASGSQLLGLDDQFAVSASLPGTLWNGLSGSPIAARFNLAGTHDIGGGFALTLESGWAETSVANLSPSGRLNDLIFGGINFDVSGLSLSQGGTPILMIDSLSLAMDLQSDTPGYNFDFSLLGLEPGSPLFQSVPNRLDALSAIGRIQPDIRAAYAQLIADLQANPFAAFVAHAPFIGELAASEPGFYIDQASLIWGDAELQTSLHMPANIQLRGLSPTVALGLEGEISGTNFNRHLQMLLREPAIQSSGLGLPINGMLIGARSVGMDLDTGATSTVQGTLLQIDLGTLQRLPSNLQVNGREIPSF